MSISGIEAVGFTPFQPMNLTTEVGAAGSVKSSNGPSFAKLVTDSIDRLHTVQGTAEGLATQAATGDLDALHNYTVAATEAQVTTQLTVAVRNKALEAFTEIMRMPV